MKKYIVILTLFSSSLIVSAQELTLEYNIGYGTFCMQDFKNVVKSKPINMWGGELSENIKVTDKFPGYLINQFKIGVELSKLHHVGLALDWTNTAGRKAVSADAGYYDFTLRTYGTRLGGFYRFSPDFMSVGVVRPYVMLSTGVVLNKVKVLEAFEIYGLEGSFRETNSMNGFNVFVEPALGCKVRLSDKIALNINAGYQFDFLTYLENKGIGIDTTPVWSGLRLQGGLIYYVSLK